MFFIKKYKWKIINGVPKRAKSLSVCIKLVSVGRYAFHNAFTNDGQIALNIKIVAKGIAMFFGKILRILLPSAFNILFPRKVTFLPFVIKKGTAKYTTAINGSTSELGNSNHEYCINKTPTTADIAVLNLSLVCQRCFTFCSILICPIKYILSIIFTSLSISKSNSFIKNSVSICLIICIFLISRNSNASFHESSCAQETRLAEEKHNIPRGLLSAISEVESRMNPFALNNAGKSYYFNNFGELHTKLKNLLRIGETNIDVGCMQLNYYYHGEKFSKITDMIDPKKNVEYAASFLKKLYTENGESWHKAVRYYHSKTSSKNKIYSKKIAIAWIQNKM